MLARACRAELIVSGMAPGIDWAAHESALSAGIRTIAVIPESLDCLRGERLAFARRIAAAGGRVLSASPPGTRPDDPVARLRRNRHIVALADAVLVVQSELSGGAMNAAAHALRLGKPLFAVPPGDGPQWEGNRLLLAIGAEPWLPVEE